MSQLPSERQPDVPHVVPADLPDNTPMLDVREDDEWIAGRAPAAVHIPLGTLEARLGEVPAGEPVVVVCRSGNRSSRAVAFLIERGRPAVNLEGGMQAWAAQNRPLTHDGPGVPQVI